MQWLSAVFFMFASCLEAVTGNVPLSMHAPFRNMLTDLLWLRSESLLELECSRLC